MRGGIVQKEKILHGDLKPDNLRFRDSTNTELVLIDWDFAHYYMDSATPRVNRFYFAPELLAESDKTIRKADSFSAGVLLHELATGTFPQGMEDLEEITNKNFLLRYLDTRDLVFLPKSKRTDGTTLSHSLIELLSRLVEVQWEKQWTAQEALEQSEWLREK